MYLKSILAASICFGAFIFSQSALADSNSTQQLLSKQYAANPNNFHPETHPKPVPASISHCEQSLLACAERVWRYQQSGIEAFDDLNVDELNLDNDSKLGKSISLAQLFIYPKATSAQANQSDIGVVVITENVTGDDSVAATRHRISFIQQTDRYDRAHWKYVSHRYQWQCVRGREGWSNKLCP